MKPQDSDRHEPDFFNLDKHRLDSEWCEQSRLYYEHAVQLADAREHWERMKAAKEVLEDELKEMDAKIALDARRNPERYGLEKVTDEALKAVVLTDVKHKKSQQLVYDAQLKVIKAMHARDILESAVRALEQRCKALEDLVRLEARNYWSEPRAPQGQRDRMNQAKEDKAFGNKRRRDGE
jgi:hypothetical protein